MKQAIAGFDYNFSGVKMRVLLTGRETEGRFCLLENESGGNSGTPTHIHEFEDETLYVLEGEMQVVLDGVVQTVRPGEAVFMPRGKQHQLRNVSAAPSRYSIVCTPSGFEDFVAEAGRLLPPDELPASPTLEDIARLKRVAPAFGISLLQVAT